MALSTELFEGGGPMILEEPLLENNIGDSAVFPKLPAIHRAESIAIKCRAAVYELAVFYDFGGNITCYRLGRIPEWSLALSPKYDSDAGMASPKTE